ncbi:3D domain-containing protein [Acetonema longum]|uniref:3D domain-containing protein n=1 Tax=Acetonema longum DSM 6540 TaxID=1009370 RepID=F7NIZ7_9FIRM|nr:3D domain-containing protein [Acetonema longum]EGO63994.1 3D domain-containing protein [Acetonema longum DSM 6540]
MIKTSRIFNFYSWLAAAMLAMTLLPPVTTAAPANYTKVLNVKATAYAPGPHDNGKWGNLTHIGTQVRPGIIAVDPKIIPLRTRVYIEFADGSGTYAVAEDTGGAIKGSRIDIAKQTVQEAYKFGIQQVKVYVLGN